MKQNQAKLNHFMYIVNCNGHFKLSYYYLILILFQPFYQVCKYETGPSIGKFFFILTGPIVTVYFIHILTH